jgi:hypothetical protein
MAARRLTVVKVRINCEKQALSQREYALTVNKQPVTVSKLASSGASYSYSIRVGSS